MCKPDFGQDKMMCESNHTTYHTECRYCRKLEKQIINNLNHRKGMTHID